jgi:hypothetical protein
LAASYLLRRDGETSGPYPRGLLLRHLALGRVGPDDEVSHDGVEWTPVAQTPDLAAGSILADAAGDSDDPVWMEERRLARLRWLDERAQPDRRAGAAAPSNESRSGADRRADPRPPRKLFGPVDDAAAPSGTSLRVVLLVVLAVALVAAFVLWFVPQYAPNVRLLQRPAAAQSTYHPAETGA